MLGRHRHRRQCPASPGRHRVSRHRPRRSRSRAVRRSRLRGAVGQHAGPAGDSGTGAKASPRSARTGSTRAAGRRRRGSRQAGEAGTSPVGSSTSIRWPAGCLLVAGGRVRHDGGGRRRFSATSPARTRLGRPITDERTCPHRPRNCVFAPLGGVGEIGMNLSIYGFGTERSRHVDDRSISASRSRGDDLPGIDLVMPDIRYLIEERRNLAGIVLTHAHEDHFGALLDLWPRLKVPVYATPFTAALLEAKRQAEPGAPEIPVTYRAARRPLHRRARSISSWSRSPIRSRNRTRLIIRTPLGIVLHTGDWKLDPTPVIGPPTDEAKLRALGEEGVPRAGRRFHQRGARRPLALGGGRGRRRSTRADRRGAAARVAVTTFASNVARIARGRRGGAGLRPRGRAGRPRHAPRHPGRARDRLSRRHPAVPRPGHLRLSAARTRSWRCAPAARASRARRWRASPRTSIRT